MVSENDRGWKRFLGKDLAGRGLKEFYARLDPEAAAQTIMSLMRGLSVTGSCRVEAVERPIGQRSLWLERK
jgi:hypothetical protein